ncbi:MAG: gamma-glutamylcyclotransferase family protein [Gammaproteobacteria bacterium]
MSTDYTGARTLFVYGTLLFNEVFRGVTGVSRESETAVLDGYARLRVRGHAFPGIVPRRGASTSGRLVGRIDAALWRSLDAFEGEFYERRRVTVHGTDNRPRAAQTYVVRPRHRVMLEARDWSPEEFAARDLRSYLARYR